MSGYVDGEGIGSLFVLCLFYYYYSFRSSFYPFGYLPCGAALIYILSGVIGRYLQGNHKSPVVSGGAELTQPREFIQAI
jgi:hypothetical protein